MVGLLIVLLVQELLLFGLDAILIARAGGRRDTDVLMEFDV